MGHWIQSVLGETAAKNAESVHFTLSSPFGPVLTAGCIAVLVVVAGLFYGLHLGNVPPRIRRISLALRTFTLLLVVFLLLDPCLVSQRNKNIEQVVAVLFDDTKSMQIVGENGTSRGDGMINAYTNAKGTFDAALRQRFHVVQYAFGTGLTRIDSPSHLNFQEPVTNVLGSLDQCRRDLVGADLAAIVLFSDGIQQPYVDADQARLMALHIPVFTVGADTAMPWRDVELEDLSVKRTNFDKSPVVATLRVGASGLADESLVAEILAGDRVIASKELDIDEHAKSQAVQLEFVPAAAGWVPYEARIRLRDTGPPGGAIAVQDIALPAKDRVVQNNTRTFTVDNRKKTYRILYFSGSPTWENKFFRRALEDAKELRLTSLVRVSRAEKKFEFRGRNSSAANPLFQGFYQDVADQPRYDEAVFLHLGTEGVELASGFPQVTGELFPYHLLIWDNIEREFFSDTQLEVTRSFVEKRGGSFLLLGGPRSFAEGGFRGTIIDGMLPVVLRAVQTSNGSHAAMEPFTVEPTSEGILNGAWNLDPNADKNHALWEGLPTLFGLNLFTVTRPGAYVMARVKAPDPEYDGQPFVAVQHYGLGQCAVMASGNSWSWHMHTSEQNESGQQRLWRQIMRSLVTSVPEAAILRNKTDAYTVNESASLEFLIRDRDFDPCEGLQVAVRITGPDGVKNTLPVDESVDQSGVYSCSFTPEKPGGYAVECTALNEKGELVQRVEEHLTVETDRREFHNAQYDPDFLKELSRETGGQFVPMDKLADLAGQIAERQRAEDVEIIRLHLWHWPPFLALMVVLLTCEWYLRRKWGAP